MSVQPNDLVDAVVLAGSVNAIPLYAGNRPGAKALVEIGGRPMLTYVLEALCATPRIGVVSVVGGSEVLSHARRWPRVNGIPDTGSLIGNVFAGLSSARTPSVLFCNPDQPLLGCEMVGDFLLRSRDVPGDLLTSWVRESDFGDLRGAAEHKASQFGDGAAAHGNLFLVRRGIPELARVRARLDRVYKARKNTVAFAWALGPALFCRFVLARLTGRLPTLSETLRIAGKPFGLQIAAVYSAFPEIVLDVDEPEDYLAASLLLQSKCGSCRIDKVGSTSAEPRH